MAWPRRPLYGQLPLAPHRHRDVGWHSKWGSTARLPQTCRVTKTPQAFVAWAHTWSCRELLSKIAKGIVLGEVVNRGSVAVTLPKIRGVKAEGPYGTWMSEEGIARGHRLRNTARDWPYTHSKPAMIPNLSPSK